LIEVKKVAIDTGDFSVIESLGAAPLEIKDYVHYGPDFRQTLRDGSLYSFLSDMLELGNLEQYENLKKWEIWIRKLVLLGSGYKDINLMTSRLLHAVRNFDENVFKPIVGFSTENDDSDLMRQELENLIATQKTLRGRQGKWLYSLIDRASGCNDYYDVLADLYDYVIDIYRSYLRNQFSKNTNLLYEGTSKNIEEIERKVYFGVSDKSNEHRDVLRHWFSSNYRRALGDQYIDKQIVNAYTPIQLVASKLQSFQTHRFEEYENSVEISEGLENTITDNLEKLGQYSQGSTTFH
jgi:hypothetical protein